MINEQHGDRETESDDEERLGGGKKVDVRRINVSANFERAL